MYRVLNLIDLERYHSFNETRSRAASKDYTVLQEHVAAYTALNAQLKDELPQFLSAIDKYVGLTRSVPILVSDSIQLTKAKTTTSISSQPWFKD